jgi:Protein of unknown function (DUF1592)/Protein of unknown function (DUF1588)/Protein of unknown function (DUF1595)/Protein of unknown function (DUF1585)/Protein of unknown function (DUF1587)
LLKKTSVLCATLIAAAPIGTPGVSAVPTNPPAAEQATAELKPIKVSIRRITESQYRHTIADVFGSDIKINARFEPEKRDEGLLAIGTPQLSLTSSGFEQYFVLASAIADQALSESKRDAVVGCKPADRARTDVACARQFISNYGERLFRRPLTDKEISGRLAVASQGAAQSSDFYAGLKLSLTSLLVAPEFLFRIETAEADPANPRQYRLDAYSKASRVAFLLWDTAPDEELLAAARSGVIHTESGLKEQLARMISSSRYEQGARAFFRDMLQLDGIENVVKDPAIYPKFSQSIADAAMEQTLQTTINLLITQKHDYRDLFTSNEVFINRPLASVYNVPFLSTKDWVPYTFPQSSERAGILTQVSFLSLFSHPGSSSPTKRGIKVNEIFKCEPTPNPPADVDFSKVKDSTNGTIRGRLLDHMENTGCTVCHRRSDPPGLALEHFDGLGQLRTTENGVPIDVSADLGGVKVVGAAGLARYLHDDPKVPACLVRNVYAYGVGRKTGIRDEDYLADQTKLFASNGYRVPDLMVQVASSPEFFKVAIPGGTRTAALSTASSPAQ